MTRNERPVEVKVDNLEFVRASPFEQRFKLTLNIKNTSSKKLFIRFIDYKIMLNSLQISTGKEPVWQSVPAFSTQQFYIVFSTNLWGQFEIIFNSIKVGEEINYYLTGNLMTGSLVRQKVTYINHSGTLTPNQIPKKIQKIMPMLDY